ncbi:nonstructural protein [Microviridae sp.]|nr:nonstructural protein [Microviridae sp.]
MYNIYVIVDKLSHESIDQPIFLANSHIAMRHFTTFMTNPNNKENQFVKFAEDFQVFQLGTYDSKTSEFKIEEPYLFIELSDLLPKEQEA